MMKRFWKRFWIILVAIVAGCTMIGKPPIEGWPKLEVVWHRVPSKEMVDFCVEANSDNPLVYLHGSPLVMILGCAEADFGRGVCDIYVPEAEYPDRWLDEHERLHCEGWDHYGGSGMRDSWIEWQKMQP